MNRKFSKTISYAGIIIFIIIFIFSLMATYSAISQEDPFGPNLSQVMKLVALDMISVSLLIIFFARKIYNLLKKNKNNGASSSSLQSKIIFIFGGIAAFPTIIIAILSAVVLNAGINSWFNNKISNAIEASLQVAGAAFNEHQKLIKLEAVNIANDINYLLENYNNNIDLSEVLTKDAETKAFSEAVIFADQPFKIIAMSKLSLPFLPNMLPNNATNLAKQNILIIPDMDRVRVLIKLNEDNLFLLVSRLIDSQLLNHYKNTKSAAGEYKRLDNEVNNIQITFSLIFVLVSTILLLISITIGIYYASYITSPIIQLVKDIGYIKDGNFSYRLLSKNSKDEIGLLSKSFNLMLERIEKQHNELILANIEISERKLFIEAILEGVPAGVIATDEKRNITLLNKHAVNILSIKKRLLLHRNIKIISPELNELMDKIVQGNLETIEHKIKIVSLSKTSIINVKIIAERNDNIILGFIATLDDITTLVSAERSNAWSDIARKIAHEVKNPLTPISLASNRLVSKFLNQVDDKESFRKYIDTIGKYTKEIARLIDEFINYAKITGNKMTRTDLVLVIKEAIHAYNFPKIEIDFINKTDHLYIKADSAQLGQVMSNLLKNSAESIQDARIIDGKIRIELQNFDTYAIVNIIDNGLGFDKTIFDKIATPYVTTKDSGTGLGLAIVKKILDDHGASIEFSNNKISGARVKIKFNKLNKDDQI